MKETESCGPPCPVLTICGCFLSGPEWYSVVSPWRNGGKGGVSDLF